jgi:nucleoside-diphosphate-sugar epimerase
VKIFVTGATGVIGRRAIPLMLERGHEVTAVARSPEKRAALEGVGARAIAVDLFDAEVLPRVVKGHDAIVNLATSVPPSSKALMPWAWRMNSRVRRVVSNNLRIAARYTEVERFIQEAFAPIYADGGDQWLTETSPIDAARYNRAVVDAESAVARFATTGGVGIALRFAYFYGPDSDFTADMVNMVRKGWAPAFGSPDGYISSVSHDDAAMAVLHALTSPGGTYNVTDDEPVTKREFAGELARALEESEPKFLPSWLRYVAGSVAQALARSQRITNARLRSTGWAPKQRSIRQGLTAVVAEMRERGFFKG